MINKLNEPQPIYDQLYEQTVAEGYDIRAIRNTPPWSAEGSMTQFYRDYKPEPQTRKQTGGQK